MAALSQAMCEISNSGASGAELQRDVIEMRKQVGKRDVINYSFCVQHHLPEQITVIRISNITR